MGCACLALDRTDPLEAVRKMAHEHLDRWLDQMAPLFAQRPPTLFELSRWFTQTRTHLLGGCMQAAAEALHAHALEQHQIGCPQCGQLLNRKRTDPKQINTLQGSFTLERPYFYCPDCRRGWCCFSL
jgi:hypothetical protein